MCTSLVQLPLDVNHSAADVTRAWAKFLGSVYSIATFRNMFRLEDCSQLCNGCGQFERNHFQHARLGATCLSSESIKPACNYKHPSIDL